MRADIHHQHYTHSLSLSPSHRLLPHRFGCFISHCDDGEFAAVAAVYFNRWRARECESVVSSGTGLQSTASALFSALLTRGSFCQLCYCRRCSPVLLLLLLQLLLLSTNYFSGAVVLTNQPAQLRKLVTRVYLPLCITSFFQCKFQDPVLPFARTSASSSDSMIQCP